MVWAATIPTPEIDVNTPSVRRYLRSDLSAASDCDSVRCYDSHDRQILARHDRKGRVYYVEFIIKCNNAPTAHPESSDTLRTDAEPRNRETVELILSSLR
jgi:hypothetical protein